jgi:two-component system sensor histidine kinase BaeS
LVQVLTNLLSNAHKYTPSGGDIGLVVARDEGVIRLAVRDTGIGMATEEQAQLFTKFFRARNRVAREAGGTGLGLVITKSLVTLHGGDISVHSTPGEGSTFVVTLPLDPTVAA